MNKLYVYLAKKNKMKTEAVSQMGYQKSIFFWQVGRGIED